MARNPPRPTGAELEILAFLWETGPATVREICDRLQQKRPSSYTTVLKFLQIMADKGLVRRDEAQRAPTFTNPHGRANGRSGNSQVICSSAFAGSAKALVLGALSARKASKKELAEIQAMLENFSKKEDVNQ